MSETYQRARSPEHKQERFEQIMEAADKLFHELPYQEISPTAIASALGWSRSNLYKYAATKEEVFLALFERENRSFCLALGKRLGRLGAGPNAKQLARAWGKTVDEHRDFVGYQAILTTILEVNVPYKTLVAFKRATRDGMLPAIEAWQAALGCEQREAVELHLALVYHAVGLRGHYLATSDQRRAMAESGMGTRAGTFAQANERFARVLLAGFESTQGEG